MPETTYLHWPFFADTHRALATRLRDWTSANARLFAHPANDAVDAHCRKLVTELSAAGFTKYVIPKAQGGATEKLDVRSICLVREHLAYHSGLADFAFAMQGLGSGPISLFGSDALRSAHLGGIADGKIITAFAISEKDAGSDLNAMSTTAKLAGDRYILNGEKTWISNAGIADQYVVFARFPEAGERSFIALVVKATDPGFSVSERIEVIAPHPLGTLRFNDCRVPADRVVGEPGKGMRVALGTLDVFRSTVGAAALGFARRALDEAVGFAKSRKVAGGILADQQLTQAKLADMALAIDASALLIYRAAWTRDSGAERITREAAMAKLHATDSAQRVIDDAVQIMGGRGVVSGAPVEQLYREIRSLRIYEGTSEIQKLIIAGQVLNG
jgi:alkylation response protein AidB-like acyl-CoA dehydrogenase